MDSVRRWRPYGDVVFYYSALKMTNPGQDNASPERKAVDWFTHLQSDAATGDDWAAFEAWLASDPVNQAAFAAVETLWVDLDLAAPTVPRATGDTVVLPFVKRAKRASWRAWAAISGVAAAIALAVLAPTLAHLKTTALYTTVETAKYERKSVILADGTRIDLNTATKLAYRLAPHDRSVLLEGGEAVFSVVHDPKRPFSVMAADRRITDTGTIFDVARLEDAVQVTVNQGEVLVAPAAKSSEPAIAVQTGRQLLYRDGGSQASVRRIDVDAALSWRSGRLIYRDAPLEAVISDLNRYFSSPIRIKGQKAAELRFSGVLVLDSEDAVVGRLQTFLPVAVRHSLDGVWISAR